MGVIGCPFVPLLILEERQHGGAVEGGLWEHHPQEEADLHRTQAHRLGWEQGQVVLGAVQGLRGVPAGQPWQRVLAAGRCVGPPLSG